MAVRGDAARVDHARAFVLHSYPYSETSLVIDAFTRDHGRVPLVARGARRPRSALRGVLLSFQPIAIAWSGRGEVRTLQRAEWLGGLPLPAGDALLCAFYLNELLMQFLAREDAHEQLFDDYERTLGRLVREPSPEPALRSFEKRLLKEVGYAVLLDHDAVHGEPIDPTALYTYAPDRGPLPVGSQSSPDLLISGRALLALAADSLADPVDLAEAKAVMRMLIDHRLEERPIRSRQVLRDLQRR